ncbi:hypothetical protein BXY58_2051 [Epilithonimonas arachidiradicis]|uniref:Uncharacterized protein n=1 Tax=Epilithonimonas arachidiradicis TaxID=1617282 RepID=A0A420D8Z7_9FLAO|nr:hypothetical protein BXY58_2051 [Epilithonimonas arachidiradicis]GGG58876.1 hypothetical protein GCM10007332_20700 [Epilithonimonas arachidiradicis]
MFIKVFTSVNNFVLVNVDHIAYINPGTANRGCSLILDTGIRLNSIDDYDALLAQIAR